MVPAFFTVRVDAPRRPCSGLVAVLPIAFALFTLSSRTSIVDSGPAWRRSHGSGSFFAIVGIRFRQSGEQSCNVQRDQVRAFGAEMLAALFLRLVRQRFELVSRGI